MTEKQNNKTKILIIVLVLLFIIIGGVALFLFVPRNTPKHQSPKTTNQPEEELKIIEKVTINTGDLLDYNLFFYKKINLDNVSIQFINKDSTSSSKSLEIKDGIIITPGEYDVIINIDNKKYNSTLEVIDKTSPDLVVKDVNINEDDSIDINSFIISCTDNSNKKCTYKLKSLDGQPSEIDKSIGTKKYIITAYDENNNEVSKEVSLTITKKETSKNENQGEKETNPIVTNPIISTKTITENDYEEIKYGTRHKVTKTYKETIYKDGTTSKTLTKTTKTIDYTNYKATSKDLKPEAISISQKNIKDYQSVTKYVNQYRSEVGASPLTLDNDISVLATIRAIEMAYSGVFSHQRPDGRDCWSVGTDLSYSKMLLAENIAYGTGGYNGTPEKVSLNWKNSQGHYNNMINSNYKKIGVGKYTLNGTTYWVQLFSA